MKLNKLSKLFFKMAQATSLKPNRDLFIEIINNIKRQIENARAVSNIVDNWFNNLSHNYPELDKLREVAFYENDKDVLQDKPISLQKYIGRIYKAIVDKKSFKNDFMEKWFLQILAKTAMEIFETDKVKYPFFTSDENKNKLSEVFKKSFLLFKEQAENVKTLLDESKDDLIYATIPTTEKSGNYLYVEYNKIRNNIKIRQKTTFGRFVRRVLEYDEKYISDGVLSLLSDQYAAMVSISENFNKSLKFLEDQEIVQEYARMDDTNRVKIHSCMTGEKARNIEMFALNPDKVKLVIYEDKARALLWTCDDGAKVLDRIYPSGSKYVALLRSWAKSNDIILRDDPDTQVGGEVDLEDGSTRHVTMKHNGIFPFLDTFKYARDKSGTIHRGGIIILSNYMEDADYILEEISGTYAALYKCNICNISLNNETAFSDVSGDVYCETCFVENFVTCNRCNVGIDADAANYVEDSGAYCDRCFRRYFIVCEKCNESVNKDYSITDKDGNNYCESCADDILLDCPICDKKYKEDDAVEIHTMDDIIHVCDDHISDYEKCKNCSNYINYNLIDNICFECNPDLYTQE